MQSLLRNTTTKIYIQISCMLTWQFQIDDLTLKLYFSNTIHSKFNVLLNFETAYNNKLITAALYQQ